MGQDDYSGEQLGKSAGSPSKFQDELGTFTLLKVSAGKRKDRKGHRRQKKKHCQPLWRQQVPNLKRRLFCKGPITVRGSRRQPFYSR